MISANDLTRWAMEHLSSQGFTLNRVNNIPYGKRKGTIKTGWADLQGYSPNGIYTAIEVKSKSDKLSNAQINVLTHADSCGAYVYICTEIEGKPQLIAWNLFIGMK